MTRNLNHKDFVRNILIISALLWFVLLVLSRFMFTGIPMTEVLTSWVIGMVNFVLGVNIFLFSLDKPNKQFMIISLGSIIIRLFLIIIAVTILITVFKFGKNYFILSLLGFYFLYMGLEIFLLNKYTDKVKDNF